MSGAAICPACPPGLAEEIFENGRANGAAGLRDYHFSLPTIHCAACIAAVERGLNAMPQVRKARVNLTLKRVTVSAEEGAETAILERLGRLGYPADLLDADTLARAGTDNDGRRLLLRLGIAGFAAMNVMLLSVAVWSGAEGATRDFLHWVSAAVAIPATIFAAQPFFRAAWAGLKAGRLVMDTPISLAILLALGVSLSETMLGGHHAYFDAALSLTFFLLLGRYLDHRSRAAAKSAATELAALEVPKAERLGADGPRAVALAELSVGDMVLVRPGMRVPVDGRIVKGMTEIDRSLLTGESAPVAASPGEEVHAGEVNLTGALEVEVTAVGADTTLQRIAELVRAAEAARNRYVSLAERAARVYAPLVHILAALAFIGWFAATSDLRLSINIATAVLIITCPCALGLAVPSVMIAASGRLFRRGVLLKDGTALERLAKVDRVVLDKTGTLTSGTPRLMSDPRRPNGALEKAAALGRHSTHPLAQALARAADGRTLPEAHDLREHPGLGIEGTIDGRQVRLGRAAWIGADDDGATWLSVEGESPVPFTFSDSMRPGAEKMVSGFTSRGLETEVLSGDAEAPVRDLAARLGVTRAVANLLPEAKQTRIRELKEGGYSVLMVGDGLNDTAALAEADVSISPASGADVTRNAADIILLGSDLTAIPLTFEVARSARRRILENFGLAATYNLIAVPLALAGYATPLMAALAMSASSICVSLNALRLPGGRG